MKKYAVYSVGTAIVDYQYYLNEFQSQSLVLDHGGAIIEEKQAEDLLLKLSAVQPHLAFGGSGANTLSVISQLGGKTFYSCKVAADEAGLRYQQNLADEGIETRLDLDLQTPTGKCFIIVQFDSERILHSLLGANANLCTSDLRPDIIAQAEYVFIEAFSSAVSASSRGAAETACQLAKAAGTQVALTLSTCRPSFISQEDFRKTVGTGVDLLFLNESEARFFCGTEDLKTIVAQLQAVTKSFVMTQGKKGALLYDGHRFYEVPAYPVVARDTTGAGDVFAGAFLWSLLQGLPFAQAGDFASVAAGKSVEQAGARLSAASFLELKSHAF